MLMRAPVPSAPTLARLFAVAALVVLAGCQSLGSALPGPGSLQRAESLAQRGDHGAAAREYEKLLEDNPGSAERVESLLRAAGHDVAR